MKIVALADYLNRLLAIDAVDDYCPNGIQVENRQPISKIVTGVTASLDLIEYAVAEEAEAILVHHGYFWKNEAAAIKGMKYQRLQQLLSHDIALLAYHLPLDLHPVFGNNVQLAKRLNFEITEVRNLDGKLALLYCGALKEALSLTELAAHCAQQLGQSPISLSGGAHKIKTIAWCTGAAHTYIEAAAHSGVDAYLSGEVNEANFYQAKELGIHYLACGHHATERYGVEALGRHLQEQFKLDVINYDSANPI